MIAFLDCKTNIRIANALKVTGDGNVMVSAPEALGTLVVAMGFVMRSTDSVNVMSIGMEITTVVAAHEDGSVVIVELPELRTITR